MTQEELDSVAEMYRQENEMREKLDRTIKGLEDTLIDAIGTEDEAALIDELSDLREKRIKSDIEWLFNHTDTEPLIGFIGELKDALVIELQRSM